MYTRVPVALYACDPISQVGLSAALRSRPEVLLVDQADEASAKICIVALEHWGADSFRTLKTMQARGCDAIILVINELTDSELLSAVEAGVCALVWRSEATPSELARVITHVASGNGALPPDVLGRLLKKVSRLQARGAGADGHRPDRAELTGGRRAAPDVERQEHRGDRQAADLFGPGGADAPPWQVGAELVDLVVDLDTRRPVAMIVDDLPAADDNSLRALAFAVRRLRAARVLLIAAAGAAGAALAGAAGVADAAAGRPD